MTNTSQEAAKSIKPSAATLRDKVYKYLDANGPSTDEEIQRGLDMNPSTERPRRGELVKQFLVVDTGRFRYTKSRRKAVIWATAKHVVTEIVRDPVEFGVLLKALSRDRS